MTSNFDDYEILSKARKSKTFKALDDQVRILSIELGKGNKSVDKKAYQKLVQKRDQELQAFKESITIIKPTVDRALYQKLDSKLTKKLDAFMAKFPHTKLQNVILQGPTGTGKTYCAKVIADSLTQKGFNVYFTSTYNLVKRMNDNLFGQDRSALSDLLDSDLLIIDDLGAEPTIKNSDEFLYTAINERYANNLPFLVTTNLSNEQILTRYDQRFFGRLCDRNRTAVLSFTGKDWRIE